MNTKSWIILAVAIFLVAAIVVGSVFGVKFYKSNKENKKWSPIIDPFDKELTEYCESNQIMGTVRIIKNEKTIYEKFFGYEDEDKKTPITDKTVYTYYSLSKPFCALGIMRLYDKGLIDLDAHPGKYLSEALLFDPRLTIKDLLYHTSGIPDFESTEGFCEQNGPGYYENARENVAALSNCTQLFAPGTKMMYASSNFTILALICEEVSGKDWPTFAKEEIFEPLGMKTARIDKKSLEIPHRACGYEPGSDGKLERVERRTQWLTGAGDVIGTVDDVYCLTKAIKNKTYLSKEAWDLVLTPNPVSKYGMGCYILDWHGFERINHNGGYTGFRTQNTYIPEEDLDIIILSNGGFGDIRTDGIEMVYRHFYGDDGKAGETFEMDKGFVGKK